MSSSIEGKLMGSLVALAAPLNPNSHIIDDAPSCTFDTF